jgi:[protein-PII] uridylyltransferase
VGRYEVSATQRATARLAQHREEVLRLVDLARVEGKRIAQDTWYFVYRAAPQYSVEPRPDLSAALIRILSNPQQLGELLRRLHELGVLEKIIPAFTHARSLLQFNQYHKYTVDEHSIRAVEESTRFLERQDAVGEVYRQLPNKWVLHLALLLHDLGKGFEEDHSEVGRRIAQETGERLGLAKDIGETISFLVHKHLVMAHLALKYDTRDAQLVAKFAEEVGTPERLDLLFLLTCADLAAVGPGVLNNWKVEFLSDLYFATSRHLDAARGVPVDQMREGQRKLVWERLTPQEQSDAWFSDRLATFPESYVVRWPSAKVVETLRRLQSLRPRSGLAWGNYMAETDTLEFIAGIDQGTGRAIFSSMAGA